MSKDIKNVEKVNIFDLLRIAHTVCSTCLYKHPNIKQNEIDYKEKSPHDKNIQWLQYDINFDEQKLLKPPKKQLFNN